MHWQYRLVAGSCQSGRSGPARLLSSQVFNEHICPEEVVREHAHHLQIELLSSFWHGGTDANHMAHKYHWNHFCVYLVGVGY